MVPEIALISLLVSWSQQSTVRVWMALGSAVVLVTRLSVTPVRRRIAVGVIWHEVESLEFFENQAIAVRIVVITWL